MCFSTQAYSQKPQRTDGWARALGFEALFRIRDKLICLCNARRQFGKLKGDAFFDGKGAQKWWAASAGVCAASNKPNATATGLGGFYWNLHHQLNRKPPVSQQTTHQHRVRNGRDRVSDFNNIKPVNARIISNIATTCSHGEGWPFFQSVELEQSERPQGHSVCLSLCFTLSQIIHFI